MEYNVQMGQAKMDPDTFVAHRKFVRNSILVHKLLVYAENVKRIVKKENCLSEDNWYHALFFLFLKAIAIMV